MAEIIDFRKMTDENFEGNEALKDVADKIITDIDEDNREVSFNVDNMMEAAMDFRIVLMEHFRDHVVMSKSSLGIMVNLKDATEAIEHIVKEVFEEEVKIEGDDDCKYASTDHDLLIFYIFNPYVQTLIWENDAVVD